MSHRPAGLPVQVTRHEQPGDTERVLQSTPVRIVNSAPAPSSGDNFHYAGMIVRMANEYDTTFNQI